MVQRRFLLQVPYSVPQTNASIPISLICGAAGLFPREEKGKAFFPVWRQDFLLDSFVISFCWIVLYWGFYCCLCFAKVFVIVIIIIIIMLPWKHVQETRTWINCESRELNGDWSFSPASLPRFPLLGSYNFFQWHLLGRFSPSCLPEWGSSNGGKKKAKSS